MADQPTNRELVVYVLGLLGGENNKVHTEDIALKCHELFADAFSWTKYPHIPDKDVVRVALTDARKEKFGGLVSGRSGQDRGKPAKTNRKPMEDGWSLTESGVRWLRTESKRFEHLGQDRLLKDHRQKVLRQLRRVFDHPLWQAYAEEPQSFRVSIGQLADFLRCRVDAPEQVWASRFLELDKKAVAVDRSDLREFLRECRRAYQAERS